MRSSGTLQMPSSSDRIWKSARMYGAHRYCRPPIRVGWSKGLPKLSVFLFWLILFVIKATVSNITSTHQAINVVRFRPNKPFLSSNSRAEQIAKVHKRAQHLPHRVAIIGANGFWQMCDSCLVCVAVPLSVCVLLLCAFGVRQCWWQALYSNGYLLHIQHCHKPS